MQHGNKGKEPWNKGKKLSEELKAKIRNGSKGKNLGKKQTKEHKDNIRKALTGRKLSSVHKQNISKSNKGKFTPKGKDHHWWKGGITKENMLIRNSSAYNNWRVAVFIKDNYCCVVCENPGGYLHADHIKPFADYPELRLDVSNGRTLCRECHYFITFGNYMPINSRWGLTKLIY